MRRVRAATVAVKRIITSSGRVFIALVMQHTMRMHHVVICGLSDSTVFLHIIS
jgi:hypothetical protein